MNTTTESNASVPEAQPNAKRKPTKKAKPAKKAAKKPEWGFRGNVNAIPG
jgi:hypothetical protein